MNDLNAKFLSAAKAIFDNLPLSVTYEHSSVNSIADDLKRRVNNKLMSLNWIESVSKAQDAGQPVFIDLDEKNQWNFLTMESGDRQDLLKEIAKLNPSKFRMKQ